MHMSKTNFTLLLFLGALLVGYFQLKNEGYMNLPPGADLNAPPMGPYDSSKDGWMSSEHMPVGPTPQNKPMEDPLMFLGHNEVKSSCCPSSFSGDQGCVCLTSQDKKLLSSRGRNK